MALPGHAALRTLAARACCTFRKRIRDRLGMYAGTDSREHFDNWRYPVLESAVIETIIGAHPARRCEPPCPLRPTAEQCGGHHTAERCDEGPPEGGTPSGAGVPPAGSGAAGKMPAPPHGECPRACAFRDADGGDCCTALDTVAGPAIARVLLCSHRPKKQDGWLSETSERLSKEWLEGLATVDREDFEDRIFEACSFLLEGGGYVGRARDAVPGLRRRPLLDFRSDLGVPFRDYLLDFHIRPLRRPLVKSVLKDLIVRALKGTLDAEDAGALLDFCGEGDGATSVANGLQGPLGDDRRHWCFDAIIGFARTLLSRDVYEPRRRRLIDCAEEPTQPATVVDAFISGLSLLSPKECRPSHCCRRCLFEVRLWVDLHAEGTPNGAEYEAWRGDVLALEPDPDPTREFRPPAQDPTLAFGHFEMRLTLAELARIGARREAKSDPDLSEARVAAWLRERVMEIAGRVKAFITATRRRDAAWALGLVGKLGAAATPRAHALAGAARAAALAGADSRLPIENRKSKIENPPPALAVQAKEAMAWGLLRRRGFSPPAADFLLGLTRDPAVPPITNQSGDGLDAVELDVWTAVMATQLAHENLASTTAESLDVLCHRRNVPVGGATGVYLEHCRVAAQHWVAACKIDASLTELKDVLDCAGRHIFACNKRLQSELVYFLYFIPRGAST